MRVAPLMTLLDAATRGDVDAVARMDARLDALLKADPAWLGTFEADAYATDWARATDKRCAAANCSWAGGFGPIDVDCRLRVDAAGLEPNGPGPRATFEFHDKTTLTITAETAADEKRFVSRPALCEYVPESGDPGDAALLMVANSPSYLMRLWPQLLNKLLYATDAGLRPFVWVGELPPRLAKPERLCLESLPAQLAKKGVDARFPDHRRLKSRHQSYYDGKYHMPSDVTFVSNHYVKISVHLHAIDVTPARWRGDAGSSPLDGASTRTRRTD